MKNVSTDSIVDSDIDTIDSGGIDLGEFISGAGTTAAATEDQMFILNTSDGKLYFDGDGTNAGTSPVQVATLTNIDDVGGTNPFSANDIQIIA